MPDLLSRANTIALSMSKEEDFQHLLNSEPIDIVAMPKGAVLMSAVPKDMLATFCGWELLSRIYALWTAIRNYVFPHTIMIASALD